MQQGLIVPDSVQAYMLARETKRAPQRVEDYVKRVEGEFERLKPFLPAKIDRLLDIGCGPAGIDVLIARHCGTQQIHLIDGDGSALRQVGFQEKTEAWADVRQGFAMLNGNLEGFSCDLYIPDDVAHRVIPADAVISLKSWGHHYPVSVYLPLVLRSLRPGGFLALDIRRNTDGLAALQENGFRCVGKVEETPKCERFALVCEVRR